MRPCVNLADVAPVHLHPDDSVTGDHHRSDWWHSIDDAHVVLVLLPAHLHGVRWDHQLPAVVLVVTAPLSALPGGLPTLAETGLFQDLLADHEDRFRAALVTIH